MTQSIVQLPEHAYIRYRGEYLEIRNHLMFKTSLNDNACLFDWALLFIRSGDWNAIPTLMFRENITYTAFIEQCIDELEYNVSSFRDMLICHYHITSDVDTCEEYMASTYGKNTLYKIIDEIRDCGDWNTFYQTMNKKNHFHKVIKKQIRNDMKKIIPWYTRYNPLDKLFLWICYS